MTTDGSEAVAGLVPHGTLEKLEEYVALLTEESATQNLVSTSTLATVWQRHILDSLQLLQLAEQPGTWVDIGSGAGLPGLVIAIASDHPTILIEPRKRRANFLCRAAEQLDLANRVEVIAKRSETADVREPSIISARAVASLDRLFAMAAHFSTRATQWILPKGRSAEEEVADARQTWQGDFRLVPSLTEPGSAIVVARDVRRRGQA